MEAGEHRPNPVTRPGGIQRRDRLGHVLDARFSREADLCLSRWGHVGQRHGDVFSELGSKLTPRPPAPRRQVENGPRAAPREDRPQNRGGDIVGSSPLDDGLEIPRHGVAQPSWTPREVLDLLPLPAAHYRPGRPIRPHAPFVSRPSISGSAVSLTSGSPTDRHDVSDRAARDVTARATSPGPCPRRTSRRNRGSRSASHPRARKVSTGSRRSGRC